MSTTPTPTPTISTDLQSLLQAFENQTKTVASKHVQVSYGIVLLLSLVLLGFVIKLKDDSFNKAMTQATSVETQYQQSLQQTQQTVQQAQTTIQNLQAQMQGIAQEILIRDQDEQKSIAAVTAPESVQKVQQDSLNILGVNPALTPDSKLAFDPTAVQGFVATKIEADSSKADLEDTQHLYELEQGKNTQLSNENASLQTSLKECGSAETAMKKVAKKSKFKQFLSGAKVAGEITLAAVVGYKIGRFL